MDLKKIFMILIGVVASVMIGALVLNVLLPNTSTALVDAVEVQIKNATGMAFDFNGNGAGGTAAATGNQDYTATDGGVDQGTMMDGGVSGTVSP